MVRVIDVKGLSKLQECTDNIRNICILAHVDHGKTTLADSLICSNGIISSKMAGKARYMDSEAEEQLRGITMKSSAISLLYKHSVPVSSTIASISTDNVNYLINLIDSPGHVDFSTDVSTAVRLCDGALLVVDVVEGVCTQTHAVLRQSFVEKVKPCLILNKIDRLITELQLTPMEAYLHLQQIIQQINVLSSTMYTASIYAEDEVLRAEAEESGLVLDAELQIDEKSEQSNMFSPEKGNVVFCSAVDCWAFRVNEFAVIQAPILEVDPRILRKTLWGDFTYNSKLKKIIKWRQGTSKTQPLFVDFVLKNIWSVYNAVILKPNKERVEKMVTALALEVPKRDLDNKDGKVVIKAIFSRWLPVAKAILSMVVSRLPSPTAAAPHRISRLWPWKSNQDLSSLDKFPDAKEELKNVYKGLETSSQSLSDHVLVYISKIISHEEKVYKEGGDELIRTFYGFARVFSGTLTPESKVYVLNPKYNPLQTEVSHLQRSELITGLKLFLMMGQDLENIDKVPAGNICAIEGVSTHVLKSATVSSSIWCPSLAGMAFQAAPIVRYAVETVNPGDITALRNGLHLLNKADPCVEILVQETGEHVLLTLGELHLARCLKDLEEKYAKVKIIASKPICGFRETVVMSENEDGSKKFAESVTETIASRSVTLTIRAIPLPENVVNAIINNVESIKTMMTTGINLYMEQNNKESGNENIYEILKTEFSSAGPQWEKDFNNILAFGPRKVGPNLLINNLKGLEGLSIWNGYHDTTSSLLSSHITSILSGFELGVSVGPLCDEPMNGVVFLLENFELKNETLILENINDAVPSSITPPINNSSVPVRREIYGEDIYGPVSGQIMSSVKEGCRKSFLLASNRLVEAVYKCSMQCTSDQLGNLYSIINKRRGKVLKEDLWEGSNLFHIECTLPVVESFGFADDLRKSTSGAVQYPQLVFSHWELLDIDPFFRPKTLDEREEHGDVKHEIHNIARKYIDEVRRRKGLPIDEKIVVAAEKQRNLSKKK